MLEIFEVGRRLGTRAPAWKQRGPDCKAWETKANRSTFAKHRGANVSCAREDALFGEHQRNIHNRQNQSICFFATGSSQREMACCLQRSCIKFVAENTFGTGCPDAKKFKADDTS